MALPIWAVYMRKVWADKTLGITPDDKFVKPTDWSGGCAELSGLGGGYGDLGGLQTMEDIQNPKPRPNSGSAGGGTKKKDENINENLNPDAEIDFNQYTHTAFPNGKVFLSYEYSKYYAAFCKRVYW